MGFVQELRRGELYKFPGIAETLDWMNALTALDQEELTEDVVDETLGVLLNIGTISKRYRARPSARSFRCCESLRRLANSAVAIHISTRHYPPALMATSYRTCCCSPACCAG